MGASLADHRGGFLGDDLAEVQTARIGRRQRMGPTRPGHERGDGDSEREPNAEAKNTSDQKE
jgi:hypothetical protein